MDPTNRGGDKEDQQNFQRETGGDANRFKLNHVIVYDETLRQVRKCLERNKHSTEFVKMYSGSYPDRKREMPEFIELCRAQNTIPYVGGGATERAIREDRLGSFVRELQALNIDTIEISNSHGSMPICNGRKLLKNLSGDFKQVLVEIGAKSTRQYRSHDEWKKDLDVAIEADVEKIVLEGLGSGNGGIYNSDKAPNGLLIEALRERAGTCSDRFIVEAPYEIQRHYWVKQHFGWNVRLGNIGVDEVQTTDRLRLDAMRPENKENVERLRKLHQRLLTDILSVCEEEGKNPDMVLFNDSVQGIDGNSIAEAPNWKEDLRSSLRSMRPRPRIQVIELVGGSDIEFIREMRRKYLGEQD